jgi:hypothetical protein
VSNLTPYRLILLLGVTLKVNNVSTNFYDFWTYGFISKILLSLLGVLLNKQKITCCCKNPTTNFYWNYIFL